MIFFTKCLSYIIIFALFVFSAANIALMIMALVGRWAICSSFIEYGSFHSFLFIDDGWWVTI